MVDSNENALLYQTSHGPMTFKELRSAGGVGFYATVGMGWRSYRETENKRLPKDYKRRLFLLSPKKVELIERGEWIETTLSNGKVELWPSGTAILGENRINGRIEPVDIEDIDDRYYKLVQFSRIRRKNKYCQIRTSLMPASKRLWEHRFVYENFYGEDIDGLEIHHIDENPYNNAPNNLMKITRSEHARLTATYQKNRHRATNLDGTFRKTGEFNRIATLPQEMPEKLRTHDIGVTIVNRKIIHKTRLWPCFTFNEDSVAIAVNSMFLCT